MHVQLCSSLRFVQRDICQANLYQPCLFLCSLGLIIFILILTEPSAWKVSLVDDQHKTIEPGYLLSFPWNEVVIFTFPSLLLFLAVFYCPTYHVISEDTPYKTQRRLVTWHGGFIRIAVMRVNSSFPRLFHFLTQYHWPEIEPAPEAAILKSGVVVLPPSNPKSYEIVRIVYMYWRTSSCRTTLSATH